MAVDSKDEIWMVWGKEPQPRSGSGIRMASSAEQASPAGLVAAGEHTEKTVVWLCPGFDDKFLVVAADAVGATTLHLVFQLTKASTVRLRDTVQAAYSTRHRWVPDAWAPGKIERLDTREAAFYHLVRRKPVRAVPDWEMASGTALGWYSGTKVDWCWSRPTSSSVIIHSLSRVGDDAYTFPAVDLSHQNLLSLLVALDECLQPPKRNSSIYGRGDSTVVLAEGALHTQSPAVKVKSASRRRRIGRGLWQLGRSLLGALHP